MELKRFYQQLAIPDRCYIGKRVYKKLIFNNVHLSKSEQQRFSEQVDHIELLYNLTPDTLNIPSYSDSQREYLEIEVLQINVKGESVTDRQRGKLADIIQRAIPYPLLLIFVCDHQIAIHMAYKRINLADSSRLTLERSFDTGWLNLKQPDTCQQDFLADFALTHCRFHNLYQCYQDLVQRVIALNCAQFTGQYRNTPLVDGDRQEQLDQLHLHQQTLAQLRTDLKKETRFNHKVELNMQIKKLDQQINVLKTQL